MNHLVLQSLQLWLICVYNFLIDDISIYQEPGGYYSELYTSIANLHEETQGGCKTESYIKILSGQPCIIA